MSDNQTKNRVSLLTENWSWMQVCNSKTATEPPKKQCYPLLLYPLIKLLGRGVWPSQEKLGDYGWLASLVNNALTPMTVFKRQVLEQRGVDKCPGGGVSFIQAKGARAQEPNHTSLPKTPHACLTLRFQSAYTFLCSFPMGTMVSSHSL